VTATTPPAATRVLVVDDERPLVDLVGKYLGREGYEVRAAFDGDDALVQAREFDPDVIVLDVMLPGVDGIEVARQVRTFSDAYIVMLTARTEEIDRIVGLSVGADDYVTKPFSPRELVARVQAMLRRPRSEAPSRRAGSDVRRFGALTIDPAAREVRRDGQPVDLTKLEFDLLDTLSSEPRVVFSKQRLLDVVWGSSSFRDEHVVAVHVANLRRKLGDDGDDPRWIRTVRGVGYRMGPR
jgi:DNA-binding response OmpR family regulator